MLTKYRSALGTAVLALALALTSTGCDAAQEAAAKPDPAASSKAISAELAKVKVVSRRPKVAGYERRCGRDDACSFGPSWSDKHTGRGGHDGCDTRNNVLARQLTEIKYKPGAKQCVVLSGKLQDPYTGRAIEFRKSDAGKVQIDHLYPLSRAWDLGASRWPLQRRLDFANDQTDNLLAVDGSTNASKSDHGPGEWMPINKAFRCTYLLRYLRVAAKYGLPITKDDQQSVQTLLPTCR
ncbi:HNH endonuclease family protein [Kribbella deserti]|uniref:HNH endonuclease family protein n=1 Tax=Kribbella deserti TaxID=1926257 RepID=A0ABV6QHI7_9ACTN